MISLPTAREGLEAIGYTFQSRKKCGSKLCGATIEWHTSPSGKWIPFRLHPRTGELIDHREECPGKNEFRSKPVEEKSVAVEPKKLETAPIQKRLF